MTTDPRQLEALRTGNAFLTPAALHALRLRGSDVRDFLQRISASQIDGRPSGEAVPVVLTTDKGRLVDLTYLLLQDDGDLLVTGAPDRVGAWLQRYVITEDVEVEPMDATVTTIVAAAAANNSFNFAEHGPAWAEAPPWHHIHHVLSRRPADLLEQLQQDGKTQVQATAYDTWCVESLRLQPGRDLDEALNPLEAGLKPFVSFTKGCYIGQEVVARLDTYDKVRRRPVLLRTNHQAPDKGTAVHSQGRKSGWVIRAAATTPALALAVAARELLPGAIVQLGNENGDDAEIVAVHEST